MNESETPNPGDSAPEETAADTAHFTDGDVPHEGTIPPLVEQPSAPVPEPAPVSISAPVPPPRMVAPRSGYVAKLVHAVWLGAGAFILLVATAVFRAAGDPITAGNVVGAMLTRWHYLALAAPLILLAMEWNRSRPRLLALLFAAILLASLQSLADVKIRTIRESSYSPISDLPRESPTRRRFGMLHGASSLLLVGQVLLAAAALAVRED
ncbi:MAG: hypothetical protein JWN02_1764 [Acidobacteria bacterium]|nr:hypothetical protein [Acidobacteriota bacterium]